MTNSTVDLNQAADAIALAEQVVASGFRALKESGGADVHQVLAYDLSHAASALATASSMLTYGEKGADEAKLAVAFTADAIAELGAKLVGRESLWGITAEWAAPLSAFLSTYRDPSFLASLAATQGPRHLDADFELVGETFHRFAEEQIRPHAEHVHRTNGDAPEELISGLAELGGFGLSVPEEYDGFATGGESDYMGMCVATEELTWGSLAIGGAMITRPEIICRSLMAGGTEAQRQEWLPKLASTEVMAAIAVTEPDFGSDVAGVVTTATRTNGGWLLTGTKTWCTFAARATVLLVLARTDPDRSKGHRGLTQFLVPKPITESHGFVMHQDAASEGRTDPDGKIEGRPIDTIGYRGMHSYEVSFENWFLADDLVIGGEEGVGRGFYSQMAGFENGRIQTA
ncbi:MAG: acyl-CoA dehydrogenase family protein, partial [Actinomycetota bacterium]